MARPPDEQRRAALLNAVVAAFAEGGVGTRSLRDIAEAAGTSHRMLLHHFGSRDALLISIVNHAEQQQMTLIDTLPDDPSDAMSAMWATLRRPELRPFERLFFECYSRGAQGEEPFSQMLPGAVDDWLAEAERRSGRPADPAMVRLGLAVMRGLLLDLVATGDEDGVNEAADRFFALLTDR